MIVIYDKDGTIRHMLSDEEYTGFIQVEEIPDGKYIEKIDTNLETPTPVFAELPQDELTLLKSRIESLELALAMELGGM